MAAILALGSSAWAAEQSRPFGGSNSDPSASQTAPKSKAYMPTAITMQFYKAQYGAAGTGLRNRQSAVINLSGVIAPVQAAYLYWGVIVPTPAEPVGVSQLTLIKQGGEGGWPVVLNGTLLATAPASCWGGDHNSYYRALVPLSVATGNGSYDVIIPPGAVGLTDGSDPWLKANDTLPQWEGASLVLVGTGTSTVNIFDSGLAGTPFTSPPLPPFTYTVKLIGTPTGNDFIWSTINADGQTGKSVSAANYSYDEQVFINGVQVSGPNEGPNAHDTDSDFNGNDASPLPQLWDTRTHDLTTAGVIGHVKPQSLTISVSSRSGGKGQDCIEVVANVVAF